MYILPVLFAVVTSQKIRSDIESHPNWKLLDQGEECGLSSNDSPGYSSLSSRIVGGHSSYLGQFPWMAPLVYFYSENVTVKDVYCGGALLSNRYVLTAAHCKPDKLAEHVKVRLGEYEVGPDPDCQDGVCTLPVQDVDVEEYSCHHHFDPTTKQNDICLVRLAWPITFNTFVFPICLPVYESLGSIDLSKSTMEIAGWGNIYMGIESRRNILQTVSVSGQPLTLCEQLFGNVIDKQLCASVVRGGSCYGDSGGPLMTTLSVTDPPRYFLLGIVSYGPPKCDVSAGPTVFTKVSEYLGWILDHIRE